jgi:tRNA(Ile)-lysidine synthase TilS/MesJ
MHNPAQLINIYFELITAIYVEFIKAEADNLALLVDDQTARHLAHGAGGNVVLAAGSSGGKDSDALVLLLNKLMDAICFGGRRVVIHADLGAIEHAEIMWN